MKQYIYIVKGVVIFIAVLLSANVHAQGIDDFGVVWQRAFEEGYYFKHLSKIQTNDPNDKGYLAFGGGYTNFRQNAIVVEFDEQGNEIRKAIYTLPPALYTLVAADATFCFGMAFKTNDGGILAFGHVLDRGASPADAFKTQYGWLKQGVIIVKFDNNLNPTNVERVRGSIIMQGRQVSDGNFVIGGLDYGNAPTDTNITLLRKYSQQGVLMLDVRSDYREINFLHDDLGVDTYLATTPDRILRINATNNQLVISSVKTVASLGLPGVEATNGVSVSPANDGGYFLNTRLKSHDDPDINYQNGHGTYRLGASDNLIYSDIQKPGDRIYKAPYLLPGATSTYIGTCLLSNGSAPVYTPHVYELIDGSAFNNVRLGIELPSGTTLSMVSRSDGFFASGGNTVEGAIVTKLSSCIKFKINNLPTNNDILVKHASNVSINIPLNYEGAKAMVQTGVKYDLQAYVEMGEVNGITPSMNGGELENLTDQTVSSYAAGIGKALDLNRTYTLEDKSVRIKYILTIKDNYTSGMPAVAQSCNQSYVFYLRSVPQSEVVAMPTIVKDGQGGATIKTSIKNIGMASFFSSFNITIYKDALGNATKHTYVYTNVIASNETVDFEIAIPNFDALFAGASKIVVNFNDNGDGNRDQMEYDTTVERDYEVSL